MAPGARGHGLGAALTAGITRILLTCHREVALGVLTENHQANRIYRDKPQCAALQGGGEAAFRFRVAEGREASWSRPG